MVAGPSQARKARLEGRFQSRCSVALREVEGGSNGKMPKPVRTGGKVGFRLDQ
jgi:hypothetical protein